MTEFGMMNTSEELLDEVQMNFLKRHWKMTIVMAVSCAAAAIVALFVFLWVAANAQATGLVPVALGQWTVGYLITFILNVIFWELLLVVSWLIPLFAAYYWWFNKQPDADIWKPGRGRREGGDAFGFLIGIAWLIMIWIDGRWTQELQTWTFIEWIYSWLTALGWVLIIFGIPAVIIFILWFGYRKKMKETESST